MSKSLAHNYQHRGLTAPRQTDSDIQMPGGNTVSRDRHPTVNLSNLNGLKGMGGSEWPAFNQVLFTTTVDASSNHNVEPSFRAAAVGAALAAFKPVDEIEGMIAAQAVALHFTAMECFRRAATPGQTPEAASKLRKDGANLARAMTDMIDALDRKRGKGPQVVRVERVVIHEGGQAIVGNVRPGSTSTAREGRG